MDLQALPPLPRWTLERLSTGGIRLRAYWHHIAAWRSPWTPLSQPDHLAPELHADYGWSSAVRDGHTFGTAPGVYRLIVEQHEPEHVVHLDHVAALPLDPLWTLGLDDGQRRRAMLLLHAYPGAPRPLLAAALDDFTDHNNRRIDTAELTRRTGYTPPPGTPVDWLRQPRPRADAGATPRPAQEGTAP